MTEKNFTFTGDMNFFVNKPLFRKLKIDESFLYDKVCPKCENQEMIFLWDWKNRAYKINRCKRNDCDYGNKNE